MGHQLPHRLTAGVAALRHKARQCGRDQSHRMDQPVTRRLLATANTVTGPIDSADDIGMTFA